MADAKSLIDPRASLLGGDFDRMFNRMMRGWPVNWPEMAPSAEPRPLRVFDHVPKAEVKENDKGYCVSVELPGLDEKDVKVQIDDDVLTISGEKKLEQSDDKTHYSERSYGSFTRAFTLPSDTNREAIAARFKNGVLSLEIPKAAQPRAQVKQVEIKSA
ncbi:MAG: Hsp20/alpha crystallin family protein [Alphaproteobacteria bacterium]|nr:Hsp20/alpha crystallin family protein [Alphaproteobacteria bacterium]MBV8410685.1 Hsp20/alpha crystallin family protein [Alphaproteobacteria bacterium]